MQGLICVAEIIALSLVLYLFWEVSLGQARRLGRLIRGKGGTGQIGDAGKDGE